MAQPEAHDPSPSQAKWDEVLEQIAETKVYAAANEGEGNDVSGDDNSYIEPSYDDADRSDESYEPTLYHETKPINEIVNS